MTTTDHADDALPSAARRRPRENFPVLSLVVAKPLRPAFACVYSFCRMSDDLADDPSRTPEQRLRRLGLWRRELESCFAGRPNLPLFEKLGEMIRRHSLPPEPFHCLLDAFEQDQRLTRHDTWDSLLEYSMRSANPVGELVLRIGGHGPQDAGWDDLLGMSNSTCTALQLVNFWQDVRRDLLQLGRVYLPLEESELSADTLLTMASRPPETSDLQAFARILRPLVDRTDVLMRSAEPLPDAVDPLLTRPIRLFQRAGSLVSDRIRACGFATLWRRPRVSRMSLVWMTLSAALQPARSRP